MTNVHSLYGNLAVTHDAPSEEIYPAASAIAESIPQAGTDARLDRQIWTDNSAPQQAGAQTPPRKVSITTLLIAGGAVALAALYWLYWKDNSSTQDSAGTAVYGTIEAGAAAPGEAITPKAKSESSAMKAFVAGTIQTAEPIIPREIAAEPAAPVAASAAAKATEFERLTAALKGMGLGVHKLDAPATAANAKPASAQEKAAELAKAAEAAKTGAASASSAQAAKPAAPADTGRAREDAARPAAPDPLPARSDAKALADASRGSAASSASAASTGTAPRTTVVVDARNCALPKYPINAYLNGDSGTVQLALLVASDGKVLESKVQKSSGFSELDKAARKALSLCKFKPADGQAEPAWATLSYVWNRD
ncbi:energy transducer TonB [Oxalobacteraceae bacterium]|nr:energy transducer TonB [Oxalobacteraceae bacterium]